MTESPSEDITVRAHLLPGGEVARGAVFIGRLGAFRFEASRDEIMGWTISFAGEDIPRTLHDHLFAAAISAIGVADGLYRQPPPRILYVRLDDLLDETLQPAVDVRDVLPEAGIAQGFVNIPGKGRFTFQADRLGEGEWSIVFGLDFALPADVALRLEHLVLDQIEAAVEGGKAS